MPPRGLQLPWGPPPYQYPYGPQGGSMFPGGPPIVHQRSGVLSPFFDLNPLNSILRNWNLKGQVPYPPTVYSFTNPQQWGLGSHSGVNDVPDIRNSGTFDIQNEQTPAGLHNWIVQMFRNYRGEYGYPPGSGRGRL